MLGLWKDLGFRCLLCCSSMRGIFCLLVGWFAVLRLDWPKLSVPLSINLKVLELPRHSIVHAYCQLTLLLNLSVWPDYATYTEQ